MLLPILHACAVGRSWMGWCFDPPAIALLLATGISYGLAYLAVREQGRQFPPTRQVIAFFLGLASLALALLGPLDTWNDESLTAHMLQHLVLIQVSAPLLILGRPVQLFLRALPPARVKRILQLTVTRPWVRQTLNALFSPLSVTALNAVALVFWHIPRFYDATLVNTTVHVIEHLCFLGTALLFWWVIVEPVPRHHKVAPVWALVMTFVIMVVGMTIGALLTLAPRLVYPFYAAARAPWGLTPLDDQQLAGVIMWVGGGLYYTIILLLLLARWLLAEDRHQAAEHPTPAN